MRRIFSDSDQCLNNKRGHNVYFFALRALKEQEFLPATVKWHLGTNTLEVACEGDVFLYSNHNPLEIARALQFQHSERLSFCFERSLLKVELAKDRFRFFSLTSDDLGSCLDHYEASDWGQNEL